MSETLDNLLLKYSLDNSDRDGNEIHMIKWKHLSAVMEIEKVYKLLFLEEISRNMANRLICGIIEYYERERNDTIK